MIQVSFYIQEELLVNGVGKWFQYLIVLLKRKKSTAT